MSLHRFIQYSFTHLHFSRCEIYSAVRRYYFDSGFVLFCFVFVFVFVFVFLSFFLGGGGCYLLEGLSFSFCIMVRGDRPTHESNLSGLSKVHHTSTSQNHTVLFPPLANSHPQTLVLGMNHFHSEFHC